MATVTHLQTLLQQRFAASATCSVSFDQVTLELAAHDLLEICHALRDEPDFKFEQLLDVCVVDYLTYGVGSWATTTATSEGFSRGVDPIIVNPQTVDQNKRFAVIYHLLSVKHNQRLRIRCYALGEPPTVPSVLYIWSSANWYEREAYDLFGVLFTGHPDLRRLLTDYGFIGHPFRKDFPLIGDVEMRYDAGEERVIYEPVSIQDRTLVPKVIRYVGHSTVEDT